MVLWGGLCGKEEEKVWLHSQNYNYTMKNWKLILDFLPFILFGGTDGFREAGNSSVQRRKIRRLEGVLFGRGVEREERYDEHGSINSTMKNPADFAILPLFGGNKDNQSLGKGNSSVKWQHFFRVEGVLLGPREGRGR